MACKRRAQPGRAGGRKHDRSRVTPASSSVGNIQRRWLRSKSQAGDRDCTGQKESLSPVSRLRKRRRSLLTALVERPDSLVGPCASCGQTGTPCATPAFPYLLPAAPRRGDKPGRKHYTLGLCILNSPSKVLSSLMLRH